MNNIGLKIISAILVVAFVVVLIVKCDSSVSTKSKNTTSTTNLDSSTPSSNDILSSVDAYNKAKADNTISAFENFIRNYPNSNERQDAENKLNNLKELTSLENALGINTVNAIKDFIDKYPNSQYRERAEQRINEIEEQDKWNNNSLATGSTPYASTYGRNHSCNEWGCSQIKVKAPNNSDVLVIIKRGDKYGKVIRHAYIQALETYIFELRDGTYQVFFYYGKGWNPRKKMTNGLKGGFVLNESFSKDEPQTIENGVLSYSLVLQTNGNFQTKSSDESEAL
jgi:hypothetical protein